jgi:hypothetical protein
MRSLIVGREVDEHSFEAGLALSRLPESAGEVCGGRCHKVIALDNKAIGSV